MAPKKLTDCPENLRESIDWLIQVRHGGDGKGLEKLASALKKLIDEAVEKARKSLDDRKQQLECPQKYWQPDSYCKKKDKAIEEKRKEIEEAESSAKSKNESKIYMLTSELKKFAGDKAKHYTEDHYLSEDAREKALKDIEERQTQLADLKNKLTGLTNEEECKKLLTNLCSGLETFLGFNSETKGYNGTGIVYSDLDRLCDAVMAFLSGVLGAVKDDDEVTTYDRYISEKEKKLESVLKLVDSKIGSGRDGLAEAVKQVKGWLEEYNDEVGKKTKAVTDELGKLNCQLGDKFHGVDGSYYKKVIDNESKSLEEQLSHWTDVVGDIAKKFQSIETDAVKLDIQLQNSVISEIKRVSCCVTLLHESSADKMLVAQVKNVDNALNDQQARVLRIIEEQYITVQRTLKNEFGKVVSRINDLNKKKTEEFVYLKRAVGQARSFITDKFEIEYKDEIIKMFQDIKSAVTVLHANLQHKKIELGNLVINAQESFKIVKQEVGNDNGSSPNSIYSEWDLLKIQIKDLVKKINGEPVENSVSSNNGINQILDGVRKYAQGFDDAAFIKSLTEWVQDIVDKEEGIVSNKIRLYSTLNKNIGQLGDISIGDIKNKIKQLLPEFIHTDVKAAAVGHLSKATASTIAEMFQKFIRKFESGFTDDRNPSIGTAAQKIEEALGLQHPTNNYRRNLEAALNAIGISLANKFKNVASEVGRFTNDTNLNTNLTQIKINVEAILHQVDADNAAMYNKGFGKKIDVALGKIKKQIDSNLTPLFEGESATLMSQVTKLGGIIKQIENMLNDEKGANNDVVINDKRRDADTKMEDLKKKILEKVDYMKEKVDDANKSFQHSTNALADAVIHAQQSATQSLSELKAALYNNTEEAFAKVTTEVRSLFTVNITADLLALHSSVARRLKTVKGVIDRDLMKGIKGLLRRMNGNDPFLAEVPRQTELKNSTQYVQWYLDPLLDYVKDQVKTAKPDAPSTDNEQSTTVEKIKQRLDALVEHLRKEGKIYNFDHESVKLLQLLADTVGGLTSPKFAGFHNPELLDALKQGMTGVVDQLKLVYIKQYDNEKWETYESEGKKLAKVCLTIITIFGNDLDALRTICRRTCRSELINTSTTLGEFFTDHGFIASRRDKQNGELRNEQQCTGGYVYGRLVGDSYTFVYHKDKDYKLPLENLNEYLIHYYRASHLIHRPKAKHPASIYDMLQWLSGMSYNAVHHELALNGFTQLFKKKEGKASDVDEDGPKLVDPNADSLPAYPKRITATDLSETLLDVCHYSHDVLIGILGHGQAAGRYACDFNTNPDGLLYPKDMNGLLCMLNEILRRLQQQLHFLYEQCCYQTAYSGWMDCHYGKGVGGSNWMCNTMQCPEQTGNQTHRQTCDQKCNQTADCGVKSPLQSFLEDGLQGFLPHQLNGNSGKLDCHVKNHSTVPCKTPMGFTDITVMASHVRTGKHLRDVLALLCGSEKSPLNALCSMLSCLLPMAPKTLGDMFAFYYHLLNGWYSRNILPREHRETAFTNAVKAANFGNPQTTLDIYPMFGNNQHGYGRDSAHVRGDLYSLCSADASCYDANSQCGPYIDSLSRTIYGTFASENADKYVSWVVYLTGTFYDLLCQLCTKCSGDCGSAKSKCRVTGCAKNSCSVSEHSVFERNKKEHGVCNSIIKCRHTHPTLYALGLTYGNRTNLDGKVGSTNVPKRTCKTFIQQLEKVCSGKSILSKLIHQTIPEYLFKIRAPFIWLNVALWLLSLLYLLHIMVIRLDLLHIKSHLHSPSSHRIAAQSLLAAARVKALNKVLYLQP